MPGFFSFFQPRQKISGHIVDLIQEEHHLPGHGSAYESYDFGIYFIIRRSGSASVICGSA